MGSRIYHDDARDTIIGLNSRAIPPLFLLFYIYYLSFILGISSLAGEDFLLIQLDSDHVIRLSKFYIRI